MNSRRSWIGLLGALSQLLLETGPTDIDLEEAREKVSVKVKAQPWKASSRPRPVPRQDRGRHKRQRRAGNRGRK